MAPFFKGRLKIENPLKQTTKWDFTNTHITNSLTAWIGSISVNLLFLFSPVTSSLAGRYGVRVVTIAGGLVMSVGLFLSSYAPSLSFLYISYGLLLGIGTSLCATMALIVSADYFDRHLSLATGIVASGSSFGTLALAPTLQTLVEKFGWQTTFRIMGLGGLLITVSGFLYKTVKRDTVQIPSQTNQCFDISVLKNKEFVLWTLATTIAGFGYFIPHFFLVGNWGFISTVIQIIRDLFEVISDASVRIAFSCKQIFCCKSKGAGSWQIRSNLK